jgi:hypothetical protein
MTIGSRQQDPLPNLRAIYEADAASWALDGSARYEKESLRGVLASILDVWQPGTIRAQDSANQHPDGYQFNGYFYDHADHKYGAYFARDAVAAHAARAPLVPEYRIYRGYNISAEDANLSDADVVSKGWMFYAYALSDYFWFWDELTWTSRCAGPRTETDPNLVGTAADFRQNWAETRYAGWCQRQYATTETSGRPQTRLTS